MAKQACRIEFKTKTQEEKKLYESKTKELGYRNLSDMIRTAINQLIDGSDESSPEVLLLQQKMIDKDARIEVRPPPIRSPYRGVSFSSKVIARVSSNPSSLLCQ
jgi:hypothetical protein